MALVHRKLAFTEKYESCGVCFFCPYDCSNHTSPPSPEPPSPTTTSHHQISSVFLLMMCVLGAVFVLFSYLVVLRCRSTSRRRNQIPLENDGGRILDENQGPMMDHHVWYIRTIGLPQSLINSIPVFDYRRGEKTIDGSDRCAVCLSEFQDNERLRLLPKCSHAFHVLCIDTWLLSHKNCPVCRAPVSITNADTSIVGSVEMGGSGSVPVGTIESRDRTRDVNENRGESPSGICVEMARVLSKKKTSRALSDLSDRRLEIVGEMERVRRSVSMDYPSDSLIEIGFSDDS